MSLPSNKSIFQLKHIFKANGMKTRVQDLVYLVTAVAFQSTPIPKFLDVLKNTPFFLVSLSFDVAEILSLSQKS